MLTLFTILIAYLVGSIPFGYLLVQLKQGHDVRDTGSGGTGATNVSRTAGKVAGVTTLVLDALKGVLAIVITRQLASSWGLPVEQSIIFAAIAVVVGHVFPVWLKFRGGKGVATAIGVFSVLAPIATMGALFVFFQAVLLTRYVSFGSIVGISSVPLWIWLFYDSKWLLIATLAIAALVVFAHRANIRRLLDGTESKFK